MPTDNFQWTDALVAEYSLTNQKMTLFEFKRFVTEREQSKQQSNKDWEIVESKREVRETKYGLEGTGDWYIHSVRRLSDNEVFTVGDMVNDGYTTMCIEKIQVEHDSIVLVGNFGNIQLRFAKKSKPILFKTEDGIDIYEGDTVWIVVEKSWNYHSYTMYNSDSGYWKETKMFSTETQAKQYILYNKPCLSLKEVQDLNMLLGRREGTYNQHYYAVTVSVLEERLKQLVEQKINNK